MEMLKIEQVIVGNDVKSSSKEAKIETLVGPLQSYQHENLQCFQCFITFRSPKDKERHIRKDHPELYKQHLHETNTVFTCYKCEKCFPSSEMLSQHQTTHNTEEKPFHCNFCQNTFGSYSELCRHRRFKCIERQLPCKDCASLFYSPGRLRNHRIAMHSQGPVSADDLNTYQCHKCSRSFQTEEDLLLHQEKFAEYVNCEIKPPGKKRGYKPKSKAQGEKVDSKKVKQEDESEEGYNNSTTEGHPSNEQQNLLSIPCPEANCDLVFPSVTALRAHKRAEHGPATRKPHRCT